MARSEEQIYNEIKATSKLYPSLSGLGDSIASANRLMMRVQASAIHIFETLLDIFKKEVSDESKKISPGTSRWFVDKTLQFQYDSNIPQILSIDDRDIKYPTVDPLLQIITTAACVVVPDPISLKNIIFIKVAKGTIDNLQPLSTPELSALTSYLELQKMAGQELRIISQPGDKIYIKADIYFDGMYILSNIKEDLKDAFELYLSNISYNNTIHLQSLVDVIQNIDGIKDVKITEMAGREYNIDFNDRTNFDRIYNPFSGYTVLEDDPNNDLEKSLTWYVV